MKTNELILDAPRIPGETRQALLYARLLLLYLSDHVHSAELANGVKVHDATDFHLWLRELAEEARKIGAIPESVDTVPLPQLSAGTRITRMPQTRWASSRACPDCDHEHEGREECGYYLGEGKFCHCPARVSA